DKNVMETDIFVLYYAFRKCEIAVVKKKHNKNVLETDNVVMQYTFHYIDYASVQWQFTFSLRSLRQNCVATYLYFTNGGMLRRVHAVKASFPESDILEGPLTKTTFYPR
ncbi:MAG TPA: hypothetical protein PLP14_00595, partial [Chitinophagaceae bacterium]|nr:hypothetical protein [Chitinophagaceae bacterium]